VLGTRTRAVTFSIRGFAPPPPSPVEKGDRKYFIVRWLLARSSMSVVKVGSPCNSSRRRGRTRHITALRWAVSSSRLTKRQTVTVEHASTRLTSWASGNKSARAIRPFCYSLCARLARATCKFHSRFLNPHALPFLATATRIVRRVELTRRFFFFFRLGILLPRQRCRRRVAVSAHLDTPARETHESKWTSITIENRV